MQPTPNLFVIGAMKAGTTSFHDMLDNHPQINMSDIKETNFFTSKTYNNHTFQWYLNLFNQENKYKYYGESSVSYSKCHNQAFTGIPKRIQHKLGTDVKFIYILRDPANRLISHFIDSKTYGQIRPSMTINEYLDLKDFSKENNHIMTSCYHYQLQEYLQYFPKENILLLEYEDIFKNTEKLRKQLSWFLDIEFEEIKFPELNVTSQKKYFSGLGYKLLKEKSLTTRLKPFLPKFIYNGIRDSKFMRKLMYQSSKNNTNKLNSQNENRLIEFFKPEVEKLKSDFGFEPKHWREY